MPKFVIRFKTKMQMEIWHQKLDSIECEKDENISQNLRKYINR